jgi:hypothetical protein
MQKRIPIVLLVCLGASGFLLFSIGRTLLLRMYPNGPQAKILPASEVDLGRVEVGQEIRQKFTLINRGNARLLVRDLKATCACTVSDLPTRSLSPGASVPLEVVYKARSTGDKQQEVLIKTNDPQRPLLVLKLRALAVNPATMPAVVGLADSPKIP